MAGLYIHIPFCESRCIYCGFYSTTSLKLRDAYVDALCQEMAMRPITSKIETIYLGGGTPSQLTEDQLIRLFEHIKEYLLSEERREKREESNGIFDGMEITMECNPDDVTESFCKTLGRLPINRISMGVQTFSDERLRFLHRRHNAKQAWEAVDRLRAAGIQNISIDLMFGFPGESLSEWQDDLRKATELGVEHISAYSLMYEEGTPLFHLLEQGKIEETDEETSREMYEMLTATLTKAGYEHYEISNFARPGHRSRHNSSYWHEVAYIGIGAAAHSYDLATRSWNAANIHEYIETINQGKRPMEQEIISPTTRYNDLITTALRTSDGIEIDHVARELGEDFARRLATEAQPHIARGLMKIKDGRLSLTHEGLFISDDVMSDFMIV